MRPLIIACVSAVLLLGAAQASARGYGGYGGHYRGHYYGHGNDYAPYFVGGLLLGTLLAPPRYAPPREVIYVQGPAYQTYVAPPVVYAQPSPRPSAPIGRRLLRDLNGDCFERTFDGRGNELRTQIPASECAW